MREIAWRIEAIIDRRNLDKVFVAKVNGCEIEAPKLKKEEVQEVSPEKQKLMDEAIEKAKLRKARQYGSR